MSIALTPTETNGLHRTVLEHVARYRMSVLEAVVRIPALRHLGRANVKRLLRQMCQCGELAFAPLFLNRPYYFMT